MGSFEGEGGVGGLGRVLLNGLDLWSSGDISEYERRCGDIFFEVLEANDIFNYLSL